MQWNTSQCGISQFLYLWSINIPTIYHIIKAILFLESLQRSQMFLLVLFIIHIYACFMIQHISKALFVLFFCILNSYQIKINKGNNKKNSIKFFEELFLSVFFFPLFLSFKCRSLPSFAWDYKKILYDIISFTIYFTLLKLIKLQQNFDLKNTKTMKCD